MRDVHASTDAVLDDSNLLPLLLVELHFDPIVYVFSGVGEFTWGGKTFLGVGNLGTIDGVEETQDLKAADLRMTLSGVDPSLVALALDDDYQGEAAFFWVAFLDSDHQMVGDPVGPWEWEMENMTGEIGETGTLTLTATNIMAKWDKPNNSRYTHEEQQRLYPGDMGLEYVVDTVETPLQWGPK